MTRQTDAHNEFQQRVYQNFVKYVDDYNDGNVDYDAVESELDDMVEDDEIDTHTYEMCRRHWEEHKEEEAFWHEEERRKWDLFRDDSVY